MKNWKTYQLSKQLMYFPGEVFCEVFRGSVPVGPKYPYSMEHSSPPPPPHQQLQPSWSHGDSESVLRRMCLDNELNHKII